QLKLARFQAFFSIRGGFLMSVLSALQGPSVLQVPSVLELKDQYKTGPNGFMVQLQAFACSDTGSATGGVKNRLRPIRAEGVLVLRRRKGRKKNTPDWITGMDVKFKQDAAKKEPTLATGAEFKQDAIKKEPTVDWDAFS